MSGEIVPQQVLAVVPRNNLEATLDDSPNRAMTAGIVIAVLFFVVLLGWAAIVRLDAAAAGEGRVTVSGNRQTVQHRDGGIIEEIDARDGMKVVRNQILIRLKGAEVAATERALAGSVIDLEAQRARLEAEINGGPIQWPASFASATGADRALIERSIKLQNAQRSARQGALESNRAVIRRQEAEASQQIGGYSAQARATLQQRQSLQEQLISTRKLADEGYVSRNTVRGIERSLQQLEGADADYYARAGAAREQAGQARQSAVSSTRRYTEDAATALRDTQFQLNEVMPKWLAAKEQLERTVIRAPVAGRIVDLKIYSRGGVIQAGQPILDIVPDAAPLVIKANFAPGDIDGVYEGRTAEVKFLSLHERDLPILLGSIRNVSADSLSDEKSGQRYFTAEIVVPEKQITMLRQVRGADLGIRPGVPVSVLVKLRQRTALQYMFDPLMETFRKSMHER